MTPELRPPLRRGPGRPPKAAAAPAPPPGLVGLTPQSIVPQALAQAALGLPRDAFDSAVTAGELVPCIRGNRRFFTGQDLLDWMRKGRGRRKTGFALRPRIA